MPLKSDGKPDLREIDRWEGGVGWISYPEETLQRASHAVVVDGEVWVLDPVSGPSVDELLADLGEVAGVVVCLDRHTRDAAVVADRHDVSVWIPDWMSGVASKLDVPVERFGRELADTGFRALTVKDTPLPPWQEVALYREDDGTLFVPEALGTSPLHLAAGERLGVHPMLRLMPPTRPFRGLSPERILVSHGEGVFDDAARALSDALTGSRRRTPNLYWKTLRRFLSG